MTDDLKKLLKWRSDQADDDGVYGEALDRIEALEKALGSMKAAFRVNMIRYANASDEEIDAVICAALGEKKDD